MLKFGSDGIEGGWNLWRSGGFCSWMTQHSWSFKYGGFPECFLDIFPSSYCSPLSVGKDWVRKWWKLSCKIVGSRPWQLFVPEQLCICTLNWTTWERNYLIFLFTPLFDDSDHIPQSFWPSVRKGTKKSREISLGTWLESTIPTRGSGLVWCTI